jgi:hypothetical protein
MSIKYSTQATATTSEITPVTANSFEHIFEKHFATPEVLVEKTRAKTFIPASFRIQKRCDANIDTSSMIIFDVDQKTGAGYDDDMITLEEAEDALRDLNLEHFIYTSHSHTLAAPRFRIVIAASRSFYLIEHNVICAAMLEELDEFFDGRLLPVVDACWKVPSQCYYVYTVHPERKNQAISFYNPGKPSDIDDLKLRQSIYGIETEYKLGAARIATGRSGERGRSYDLNRILGGMFTSSTEEDIAARLFEHDNTAHAGNEYFRDQQYPRNRPRHVENKEAAAWRSCKLFTKSHINSLKRKCRKQGDVKIVNAKAQSKEPMLTHDAMIKFRSVKNQPTKQGAESVLIEMQVMSGEHAGRHFWHRLYGFGNSEMSVKISNSIKDKIAKATKMEINTLIDVIKAEGKIVSARIKYKPGINGFPAQNEIGDLHLN